MTQTVWSSLNQLCLEAYKTVYHKTLQEKYVALLMTRVTELCHDASELILLNRIASVHNNYEEFSRIIYLLNLHDR